MIANVRRGSWGVMGLMELGSALSTVGRETVNSIPNRLRSSTLLSAAPSCLVTLSVVTTPAMTDDGYDILVVDDQPMIIEAVRRLLLVDPMARVHGCQRAVCAMAQAIALKPAVILQDLTMPDGDGIDLVTQYRGAQELSECSVVVLSATEDALVKAQAFACGASDYIEKLPPPPEFIARVQHHARASRALAARNRATAQLEAKDRELQERNSLLDEANARLSRLNQELVVDIGQQRQRVAALASAGARLAEIQDLDLLLTTILEESTRFLGATAGAVFVFEGDALRARTVYSHGKAQIAPARVALIPLDAPLVVATVAREGKAIRLNSISNPLLAPAMDGLLETPAKSLLVLPITRGKQVLGVLALFDGSSLDGFSAEDERLLQHFTGLAAVAIERAQASRSLLFRMVAMAALRDPSETAEHVQRVAGVSEILFQAWLKVHEADPVSHISQRDKLRTASFLHDVGKVGITDAILKKPGKLDDAERSEMQRHSHIGSGLFSGIRTDYDDCAAEVALCHHEKWDGSGYPHGLKGDSIPLFARIVAVADVYDALGSRRAYKEPWPREKIVALFRDEAGRHFDPELAAMLIENIESAERVRDAFVEGHTDSGERRA